MFYEKAVELFKKEVEKISTSLTSTPDPNYYIARLKIIKELMYLIEKYEPQQKFENRVRDDVVEKYTEGLIELSKIDNELKNIDRITENGKPKPKLINKYIAYSELFYAELQQAYYLKEDCAITLIYAKDKPHQNRGIGKTFALIKLAIDYDILILTKRKNTKDYMEYISKKEMKINPPKIIVVTDIDNARGMENEVFLCDEDDYDYFCQNKECFKPNSIFLGYRIIQNDVLIK